MEPNIFETLIRQLYELSGLLCHQLETRCLTVAGVPLPVCSRCSGIYLGAAVFVIFHALAVKWPRRIVLSGIIGWVAGFSLAFLLFDVYAGYRMYGDIHPVRFGTGYLFGFMLAWIMGTLNRKQLTRRDLQGIALCAEYRCFAGMIIGLSMIFLFYILFREEAWMFYASVICVSAGAVMLYSAANTLLFFWIFDRLRHRCGTFVCVVLSHLTGASLFIIQMIMIRLFQLTI